MFIRKFSKRDAAFDAANATTGWAVILGDSHFWVVSMRDAERLFARGYEYAD